MRFHTVLPAAWAVFNFCCIVQAANLPATLGDILNQNPEYWDKEKVFQGHERTATFPTPEQIVIMRGVEGPESRIVCTQYDNDGRKQAEFLHIKVHEESDGQLIIAGGGEEVYVFDLKTNEWRRINAARREDIFSIAADPKFQLHFGGDNDGRKQAEFPHIKVHEEYDGPLIIAGGGEEVFDPKTNEWRRTNAARREEIFRSLDAKL